MSTDKSPLALKVDIVSDVVCPWCIIGYLQLQEALQRLNGQFCVDYRWHPFELSPNMPPEGQNLREYMSMKYGSTPEQSSASHQRLTQLGEALGFQFNYSGDTRMVNTFHAHQLLHWAFGQALQTELKLALFDSFFTRQEDVSDTDTLVAVAQRVNLPGDEAHAVLAEGRYAEIVREAEQAWRDREVHAVPTFLLQGRYQVPGAQDADTFERILRRLLPSEAA
ncbi:MAG: DsbA family oxidoreductase [Pseudomonadota bacterium]